MILYYYAHVQSHIQYGIEIYGLTAKTHLLPLDSIINKSVQVMTFMNYVDHVSPTRVKLGIPNFKVLFYRSIADKMFRIINKVGHAHNSFEFGTTTGTRSLRSNVDCVRLKHKKIRTNLGKNSFDFTGCQIWNFIPYEYKQVNHLVFKKHMKFSINWDNLKL